ncbi:MAG: FAD-dependent thymidylate synthase [Selenomonadaceae bacterium]|nr:FAD-dependent thymidylate synthase [Selenomonadaceae bacterium]
MKIVQPSAELVDQINPEKILKKIELCGRVSHQSKLRDDSAEQFVRMLIKRGHESVLEHVSLTFHIICDRAI